MIITKVFTLAPRIVKLEGSGDRPLKTTVRIIPRARYAFKILSVRAQKGEHITFHLAAAKEDEKPSYLLTVENTRTE